MRRKKRLRLRSPYRLYQRFFGLVSKASDEQRRNFAKAVGATNRVLTAAWVAGTTKPIHAYIEGQPAHPLAVQFLAKLLVLIKLHAGSIRWRHVRATIDLRASLFPDGAWDGMVIPFEYLLNEHDREIVVPVFGPPKNILSEIGILLCLFEQGDLSPPLPPFLTAVTYWNLAGGDKQRITVDRIPRVDPKAVLDACASLMNEP